VQLSRAGARKADLGQRNVNAIERRVTAGFSVRDKRQLARLLARLREAVRRLAFGPDCKPQLPRLVLSRRVVRRARRSGRASAARRTRAEV
jgi:hypothetical protein